jgi:hypothetical protein
VELPEVRCPHGRLIERQGVPTVVCGAMERDQARADRILEGSPVGVLVSARNDPTTFFGFCCGEDEAPNDPAAALEDRIRAHFSCCPVFLADREITSMEDRLFKTSRRPEEDAEALEGVFEQDEAGVTTEDLGWLNAGDEAWA